MVSQSAETSCITWLENSTVWPSLFEAADDLAHRARAHHVEAVGRLVEQHVLRVVDDGAGQRGLGALAVREAGDAAIGDRRHVEHLQQVIGAAAQVGAGDALQLAEVVDVLARREARIQARLIRQHAERAAARPADRRPHRRRRRGCVPRRAASACRACAASSSCRRRSGRAGPVTCAVGGGEADAVNRVHVAEALVQVLDADHLPSPFWFPSGFGATGGPGGSGSGPPARRRTAAASPLSTQLVSSPSVDALVDEARG